MDFELVELKVGAAGIPMSNFLENHAGINVSTWNRWKRGATSPNFSTWKKIETALETLKSKRG